MIPSKRDATAVLDRDFLEIRTRILDIASALDRHERAPGHPGEHPDIRMAQVRRAIEALLIPGPGRVETIQRIFSLDYDPHWQSKNGSSSSRF